VSEFRQAYSQSAVEAVEFVIVGTLRCAIAINELFKIIKTLRLAAIWMAVCSI
jgi:hypothetical protein